MRCSGLERDRDYDKATRKRIQEKKGLGYGAVVTPRALQRPHGGFTSVDAPSSLVSVCSAGLFLARPGSQVVKRNT